MFKTLIERTFSTESEKKHYPLNSHGNTPATIVGTIDYKHDPKEQTHASAQSWLKAGRPAGACVRASKYWQMQTPVTPVTSVVAVVGLTFCLNENFSTFSVRL